jgi:hypothetical protein
LLGYFWTVLYVASFPYHSLLHGFVFFAGLVLLCYEKQHCSEMTEDNSLQDNEERDDLLLTSRSVAAAWDGEHVPAFSPRGYFLVFVFGSATWCCNLWHYRCFHLWYG